jgi:5'-nucleotidase
MRILLTNDDGIRAPGIAAMYEALTDHRGRFGGPLRIGGRTTPPVVHTIAPLTVQSATGHGITFHNPIMVDQQSVDLSGDGVMDGVSVDARPADCVKLALSSLWTDEFGPGSRPDLVISGMNDGANVGINVVYSGTVAAAIEAAFLGVPSIAVSMLRAPGKSNYEVGAAWCRIAIERILRHGLPRPHECISINVPRTTDPALSLEAVSRGDIPEMVVCPMNTHGLVDKYERRVAPGGEIYYWAAGHGLDFRGTDPDSDVDHLLKGRITITPLMYDLTRRDSLRDWTDRLGRPS